MLALIDADCIVYGAGFASQMNTEDGLAVKSKKEAFGIVNSMIDAMYDSIKFTDCKLYLTKENDKTNFRYEIATLQPYKGNRKKNTKPALYKDIREFIIDHYKASVIEGMEADDALGIEQMENHSKGQESIICTIDKDLNMIPGLHYNWQRKSIINLENPECLSFFYKQILSGDYIDNIPGIYKLTGIKADYSNIFPTENEEYLYQEVLRQYYNAFCKTMLFSTPQDILNEVETTINELGQLLWIKRHPNDCWKIPEVKL